MICFALLFRALLGFAVTCVVCSYCYVCCFVLLLRALLALLVTCVACFCGYLRCFVILLRALFGFVVTFVVFALLVESCVVWLACYVRCLLLFCYVAVSYCYVPFLLSLLRALFAFIIPSRAFGFVVIHARLCFIVTCVALFCRSVRRLLFLLRVVLRVIVTCDVWVCLLYTCIM